MEKNFNFVLEIALALIGAGALGFALSWGWCIFGMSDRSFEQACSARAGKLLLPGESLTSDASIRDASLERDWRFVRANLAYTVAGQNPGRSFHCECDCMLPLGGQFELFLRAKFN